MLLDVFRQGHLGLLMELNLSGWLIHLNINLNFLENLLSDNFACMMAHTVLQRAIKCLVNIYLNSRLLYRFMAFMLLWQAISLKIVVALH